MTPSSFFETFLAHNPERHIRLAVARGAAPLAPREMIHLLALLARDPDEEVSSQAARTLEAWSADAVLEELNSRACPIPVLEYFSRSNRTEHTEAVILNPATPGPIIEDMATRVPGPLLEAILYNRVRLLEFPGIVRNAGDNPAATPEVRRLVREIEQEFFSNKKLDYSVATEASGPEGAVEASELETELPPDDLWLEGLPSDADAREGALIDRLAHMTVRQKIKAAMLGPREARSILIRDTNLQVSRAVLESPKLTESEIEAFASMRNVSDEILRNIGSSRAWLRSYPIALSLVRNPRTPPTVSQTLVMRLQTRDLQAVTRDRGISELVRRQAQRTLNKRMGENKSG